MKGVYHFCGEARLHRYLAEFDLRYNNRSALGIEDTERATKAIRGAEGKRLMYAQPSLSRSRLDRRRGDYPMEETPAQTMNLDSVIASESATLNG